MSSKQLEEVHRAFQGPPPRQLSRLPERVVPQGLKCFCTQGGENGSVHLVNARCCLCWDVLPRLLPDTSMLDSSHGFPMLRIGALLTFELQIAVWFSVVMMTIFVVKLWVVVDELEGDFAAGY